MSDPTATPPRCPTCGNEGPVHGKAFCEVCGEFVDWGELAAASRRNTGPSSADTEAERRRARELLVPVGDSPEAVLPGRPDPTRPDVRSDTADDESGQTCWNCGVGNRSDRRFCRHCGVDLQRAPQPAGAPSAPRPPRTGGGFGAWLRRYRTWLLVGLGSAIVLAALVVTGFLVLPGLLGDDTAAPAEVSATSTDPAHPPTSAFDGNMTSWWGSGKPGTTVDPGSSDDQKGSSDSTKSSDDGAVTATFAKPTDLRSTRIVPGTSDRAQDRNRQHRPQRVDLTFVDAAGRTKKFSVKLDDKGPQEAATPVDDVVKATVTVRSAYTSGGGQQVAIAEVQFKPRK